MRRLNEQQQQAVECTQGKLLVLAGAGSGKTSVIISRILYLIQKQSVDPFSILGLTFTNKAAAEMKNRLSKSITKDQAELITLCTFHSYCFHLLKKEIHHLGYTNQFSIYDERDIKRVLQNVIKAEGENFPSVDKVFAMVKEEEPIAGLTTTKLDEIKLELLSSLKTYNAVDFDGLISLTLDLFEQHHDILDRERKRFQYIMIDEYQDTNPQQYALAMKLCSYHHNLCVVGDDDQSIYGWRGAQVDHILHFSYDHLIKLEQNYRSTPNILNSANSVIKNNKSRYDKTLWSKQSPGNLLHVFHAPTEEDEADAIVTRLIDIKTKANLKWSDIAILYRSNNLSRIFETKLIQAVWQKGVDWVRGIPYQIVQGTEFYERAEVKDIVAYLKCIVNPKDQESLLRIINYPRRGISDQTLKSLTTYNRTHKIALWDVLISITKGQLSSLSLSSQAIQGISLFVSLMKEAMQRFDTTSFSDAFSWLIGVIGYKDLIMHEVKSEQAQAFKLENIETIKEMLTNYQEDHPDHGLHEFLSDTMLDSDKYQRKKNQLFFDKLQLMTFHSAKGLEFEACFLVGLEDGILPHEKSMQDGSVEEERRLFYVALTRAKKYLSLSMCRSRKKYGKQVEANPSRFLFEIPKDLMKVTRFNFPESFDFSE
ncbi:MAG: UvrD-helicase domain-containing protein [Chlamydiales bacterium]|nr:UvrD-helicase domain-containing protein [Chlamydiales bacterium]